MYLNAAKRKEIMTERILLTAEDLHLSIGRQILFNGVSFSCCEREHVALIGRNGCGKSTLLKIIAGLELPAEGNVARAQGLRMALLPQDFELDHTRSIAENIRDGLHYFEDLLRRYNDPSLPAADHEKIERELTRCDAWHPEMKIAAAMDKLHLPEDRQVATLSGGEMRRVALARAIVGEPDLLLLDEPTNHLDVQTIEWIEQFLASWRGSTLFVTHDRCFLDRIATRILELDHGKIYSYTGSYADYLAAKAAREEREDIAESKRKKFLREEIEWVRKSPKARLRRNMGRLKHYEEIAAIAAPERDGEIELVIPPAPRLGNQTVQLKEVSLRFGERVILDKLDFEFTAGVRLGVVGPNGIGKSSLLKMITGMLPPTEGEVKVAPTVQFNYIDQSRLVLDENKTVAEEIGEGVSYVQLGNERISIWGYLKRFLFEDERINTQIRYLSGGEKARLTLAKILKQGGNFLILDEPTNDLDLSSLRLLEDALMHFDGCLVTVSHDRYFLNRVSTHILGFEGDGKIFFTPGDYDYYQTKRPQPPQETIAKAPPKPVPVKPEKNPNKLTFKEKKELESMEDAIAGAEEKVTELEAIFSAPDFFEKYGSRTAELQAELAAAKETVERLYLRWEELEAKNDAGKN